MRFHYGLNHSKIDITKIVLTKCIKDNKIIIPKTDLARRNLFGVDPHPNKVKNVYINNIKFLPHEQIIIDKNKKICICFFGVMRSLKFTIFSIHNNIIKELIKHGYYINIYLHTYNLDIINNKRSNEKNIKLNVNDYKLLQPDFVKITSQRDFDSILNLSRYLIKGDPWPENPKVSLLNLLRQLNSLNIVTKMHSHKNYLLYLYLRPDIKYLNKFDINIIKNYRPNEFYTPIWGKFGGLNDRIGLGDKSTMIKFGNRIAHAANYSKTNKLHSETFLKNIMRGSIIKDINLKANRIRANGYESRDC
tara:strand:- start:15179 stop:16093 length:915 start_codon:yes stop_codon:yes gene_type:complete